MMKLQHAKRVLSTLEVKNTSDMLLELRGQRHRGSAGSYQASIGFSRATFG